MRADVLPETIRNPPFQIDLVRIRGVIRIEIRFLTSGDMQISGRFIGDQQIYPAITHGVRDFLGASQKTQLHGPATGKIKSLAERSMRTQLAIIHHAVLHTIHSGLKRRLHMAHGLKVFVQVPKQPLAALGLRHLGQVCDGTLASCFEIFQYLITPVLISGEFTG